MNAMASHRSRIAAIGCLLGRRGLHTCQGSVELHHVAEGSGKRDPWALVPLCEEGHRGSSGIHGMGSKGFLRLYRPPGETEWGLLAWLIEDMAKERK